MAQYEPGIWIAWQRWKRSSPPCRAFISSAFFSRNRRAGLHQSARWRVEQITSGVSQPARFSFGCFRCSFAPIPCVFFRQLFQDQLVGMLISCLIPAGAARLFHHRPQLFRAMYGAGMMPSTSQVPQTSPRAFEGIFVGPMPALRFATQKIFPAIRKSSRAPLNVLGGIWKRETKARTQSM